MHLLPAVALFASLSLSTAGLALPAPAPAPEVLATDFETVANAPAPSNAGLAGLLQSQVEGKVYTIASVGYAAAAGGYDDVSYLNLQMPAFVLQPTSVDDVAAAVKFAYQYNITTAVKGGAHSDGRWVAQNGLTIDMSTLAKALGVKVDPVRKVVTVTGGHVYLDYITLTEPYGFFQPWGAALTTGTHSDGKIFGMGLALGGGIGFSNRAFGLTTDSILSLEVVLANGTVVNASATSYPDLFSGMHGAGTVFGAVTRLEFQQYSYDNYYGGVKEYIDVDGAVLRQGFAFAKSVLSDYPTLGIELQGAQDPASGSYITGILASWPGGNETLEEKAAVFDPLSSIKAPLLEDTYGQFGYVDNELIDTNASLSAPKSQEFVIDGVLTWDRVTEGFLTALVNAITQKPVGAITIYQVDFIGKESAAYNTTSFTPFKGMDLHYHIVYAWAPFADAAAVIGAAEEHRDTLSQYNVQTQAYVNLASYYTSQYLEGQVGGADNLAKLRALKQKYDPTNFFKNHPFIGLWTPNMTTTATTTAGK